MLKQSTPSGCGMYAVANALNMPEIATEERLKQCSEFGNMTGQLDKWIQEAGKSFYMQPLFYDGGANIIPDHHTSLSVEGCICMPLVLCCTLSDGGLSHMIGASLMVNGVLVVYDSLKSEPFYTTLPEVHNHYNSVFGLFAFCDIHTGDYAFIS